MAPITLQRLVQQLDKLKPKADTARLKTHDYARWLARMIRRLRERGLDADRAAATVALAEALKRGAITATTTLARPTIVVDSYRWKVYPTGRITVYGKD